MITRAQCDELLAFLPAFENPGPELAATWPSMEPDPVTGVIEWPHPTNHSLVSHFFELAGQPWWHYGEPDAFEIMERMRNPDDLATASMDEVRAMLTKGVRGERFSDGLQDSMVRTGVIGAVLRRLKVLRDEMANR